ncbi:MAG: right-handed parallel beta-helix repeat-containing protein [Clostridiales bacterium]|jgi:hypothetical protein|nr:right-handed parallel beta-helix repeat-containing protein [Clostridiales bacterium]
MKKMNKNFTLQKIIVFLMCFFIAGLGLYGVSVVKSKDLSVSSAEEVGTTYYVSTSGSDSNDGKSTGAAWATLAKVNGTTFQPGDKILLKSGDVWTGFLWPKGEGTAANPITLGKYGGDVYPRINSTSASPNTSKTTPLTGTCILPSGANMGLANDAALVSWMYHNPVVLLQDQSYWTIENLELTNNSASRVNLGILVLTTSSGSTLKTYGITIRDNYIHDVAFTSRSPKPSGGIVCSGLARGWNGEAATHAPKMAQAIGFDGLYITNNKIIDVANVGIRTSGNNLESDSTKSELAYMNQKKHINVTISDNYIENVPCDGIVVSEVGSNGLCERNIVKNAANRSPAQFGENLNFAGIWGISCNNVRFRYNEVYGIQYGYNDGEAFDFDNNVTDTIFEYNFSHNNNGGLVNIMHEKTDPSGPSSGCIFRYNISANDAFNDTNVGDEGSGKTPLQQIFHQGTGNIQVYNNTIWNNGSKSVVLTSQSSGSSTTSNRYFYNNLILGSFTNPTNYSGSKNLTSGDHLVNPTGYAANPVISYETKGVGDEYVALFRQRTAYFQLKPTAAAIGGGVAQYTHTQDFYGNPLTDTVDVGAHEFNTTLYNSLTAARTTLTNALNAQSPAPVEANYTAASWAAYQTILTDAQSVLTRANAFASDGSLASITAAEITTAATAVQNSQSVLVIEDHGARTALLDALNALPTLTSSDYTADSWTAYQAVIASAWAVYNNALSTPAQLHAATDSLGSANAVLVTNLSVAKAALLAALNGLPTLNSSDYTTESWAAYQGIIASAQSVYDNGGSNIAQLEAAKLSLSTAHTVLVTKISVAKAALLAALNGLPTLNSSDYTTESWVAYLAIIANAQSVYDNAGSTLTQLEAAAASLSSAQAVLVTSVEGRRAALLAALNALPALNGTDYTSESWTNYQAVITAAWTVHNNAGSNISQLQAAIDSLTTAESVLVTLSEKLAEAKAALDAALKALPTFIASEHTPDSWAIFMAIVTNAQNLLANESATITQYQSATVALGTAPSVLVKKVDAAKVRLQNALMAMPTLTEADYTADSWTAYQAIISNAQSVYLNGSAVLAQIEAAITSLTTADTALVTKIYAAAKAALLDALTALPALIEADYTAESLSDYLAIIQAAQDVYDDSAATVSQLDTATDSLTNAQDVLVTKISVAQAALLDALNAIPALTNTDYTNDSWTAYRTVIEAAQAVYDDAGSTLAQLEAAIDALDGAQDVLITNLSVARTRLLDALNALPTLISSDYTSESWISYQNVISNAYAVYDDGDATVAQLLAAADDVSAAYDVLALVPEEPIAPKIPTLDNITLKYKETTTLSIELEEGVTIVSYRSGDSKIFTVDANGKITALKKGTATVYATDSNGLTISCSVTVEYTFWNWITLIFGFGWLWM